MARTPASSRTGAAGFVRMALVGLTLALALAACGRRGALEAPPDPSAPKEQKADDSGDAAASLLGGSPVGGTKKKKPKGIVVPDRPFILDALL